jgi:hypothetical protein
MCFRLRLNTIDPFEIQDTLLPSKKNAIFREKLSRLTFTKVFIAIFQIN